MTTTTTNVKAVTTTPTTRNPKATNGHLKPTTLKEKAMLNTSKMNAAKLANLQATAHPVKAELTAAAAGAVQPCAPARCATPELTKAKAHVHEGCGCGSSHAGKR